MQRNRSKSDTDFLRSIGLKIKAARKTAGLTQQELAELLNMDRSALSHIELGKNAPLVTTLKLIADTLRVDIVHFFETSPSFV
jgi:transcriptional regulator with XRE-family HTH domain